VNYTMEEAFGESSPFRLLASQELSVSFVTVNPYEIVEDYSFEIEDKVLKELFPESDYPEDIAVLCLVRPDEDTLCVNLRSPLVVNTRMGMFIQTVLQSESYGVSVPFALRKKAQ
jgi:flagellar assembly factor FliW